VLKLRWICSRGYGVLWFQAEGVWLPPNLQRPLAAKLCIRPQKFRCARTCSRFSITLPSLVGLGFHPPPGWPKTLSFFVCQFVTLLNVRDCASDFAMKALEYRNDFNAVVVFNLLTLPPTVDITKCRSPKSGKIGVFRRQRATE